MKTIQTEPPHAKGTLASIARPRHLVWANPRHAGTPLGGWTKRSLDFAVALIMLVVFSPLILGLALLVYLTSPGSIFYRHRRVGYLNRSFFCLKLRTMVMNSEEVLQRHLQRFPEAQREWEETFKLREDPRVTPIGHVLRKFSLDELPQLINVLRGDMSLVGPRPVPNEELQRYGRSSRFYVRARPGITGLWQVSGRNNTTYNRRIAYDRAYVTRFSTAADIAILAQTLPAAMRSDETS